MIAPYKINWRGRAVFKNAEAVGAYYMLAFHNGKKHGYELRMQDEKLEQEAIRKKELDAIFNKRKKGVL